MSRFLAVVPLVTLLAGTAAAQTDTSRVRPPRSVDGTGLPELELPQVVVTGQETIDLPPAEKTTFTEEKPFVLPPSTPPAAQAKKVTVHLAETTAPTAPFTPTTTGGEGMVRLAAGNRGAVQGEARIGYAGRLGDVAAAAWFEKYDRVVDLSLRGDDGATYGRLGGARLDAGRTFPGLRSARGAIHLGLAGRTYDRAAADVIDYNGLAYRPTHTRDDLDVRVGLTSASGLIGRSSGFDLDLGYLATQYEAAFARRGSDGLNRLSDYVFRAGARGAVSMTPIYLLRGRLRTEVQSIHIDDYQAGTPKATEVAVSVSRAFGPTGGEIELGASLNRYDPSNSVDAPGGARSLFSPTVRLRYPVTPTATLVAAYDPTVHVQSVRDLTELVPVLGPSLDTPTEVRRMGTARLDWMPSRLWTVSAGGGYGRVSGMPVVLAPSRVGEPFSLTSATTTLVEGDLQARYRFTTTESATIRLVGRHPNDPTVYAPRIEAEASYARRLGRMDGLVTLRYVGSRSMVSVDETGAVQGPSTSLSGPLRLDVEIGARPIRWLRLFGRGENLTNARDRAWPSVATRPWRVLGGIEWVR